MVPWGERRGGTRVEGVRPPAGLVPRSPNKKVGRRPAPGSGGRYRHEPSPTGCCGGCLQVAGASGDCPVARRTSSMSTGSLCS